MRARASARYCPVQKEKYHEENRFAKGLASQLDVDQASAVLATTRADVPTLASAIQTAD
jgi:hypothetical protein